MAARCLTVAAMLAFLAPPAGTSGGGYSREFKQTVTLEAGGELKLETHKGSIRLTPWDRNQVEITARIEAAEDVSEEYAQRSVEATRIDVWDTPRSVSIRSDYDDVPCQEQWWALGCSKSLPYIHYEIRAPRKLDLRLKDHKSDIDVAGFAGSHRLHTYKGTLRARDLAGAVRLETYKGRAALAGLRGRVEAETYKGDLRLEADEISGDSRLETYKGKIVLGLPQAQAFSLRADLSRRADFTTDFDLTVRTYGRKRLEGSVSGGGPQILVRSQRGQIHLRRR